MDDKLYQDIDYLNNEISKAELELGTLYSIKDNWIESTCDICTETGKGFSAVPMGWGWNHGYIFCPNCITKWKNQFGDEVKFYKTNPEDNDTLFDTEEV